MKPKLKIITLSKGIFVPIKRLVYLLADGSYTIICVRDKGGGLTLSTQSYNLGKYLNLLDHDFIQPRNNYLVNKRYVSGIGRDRTIYLSCPNKFAIVVPKARWKAIKEQLNRQLVIPLV